MAGNNAVSAVYRYNHSMAYVTNVLAWAAAYSTGVMPTQGIPDMHATPVSKPADGKPDSRKPGDREGKPEDKPAGAGQPGESNTETDKAGAPTTQPKKAECFIVCLPPELGGPKRAPAAPKAATPRKPEQSPVVPAPAQPGAPG